MMSDYLTLTRAAAIAAPILFSMLAFYLVSSGALRKVWLRHAIFFVRIATAAVFIAVAFSRRSRSYLSFSFPEENYSWLLTALLSAAANRLACKAAAKKSVQKNYPQLRMGVWSNSLMAINLLTWLIYLFGYELFFRGYLLHTAAGFMSIPMAVGLNLFFYAIAHSLKGWKEIAGSIPFGLLVCVLSIATGNIWSAFIIHASMALSVEWFTAKRLQRTLLSNAYSAKSYENA